MGMKFVLDILEGEFLFGGEKFGGGAKKYLGGGEKNWVKNFSRIFVAIFFLLLFFIILFFDIMRYGSVTDTHILYWKSTCLSIYGGRGSRIVYWHSCNDKVHW